ncbi:MAG: alpha-galactosidase [Firmicutes bacterium]|nr:alpha-galactosidase [Bacillota bacterium]
MSIIFDKKTGIITMNTKNTSYQVLINEHNFLLHLYYGQKIHNTNMTYLYMMFDRACAGNPNEVYPSRTVSFNVLPQEYTGYGVGDFRVNSIALQNADGSYGVDFRYVKHEIKKGKYALPGLPASYDNGDEADTLIITIEDALTKMTVDLYYGVFEEKDMITRCAKIINNGQTPVTLHKASSMCIDFPYGKWDLINFHGKHALERQIERRHVSHAIETVGSTRGTSSHQQNPFIILTSQDATEDFGDCYGFMFVYSGGFKAEVERDQFDSTRVVMGIQDEAFTWDLKPECVFYTPEVIMTYTGNGLSSLSHNYHDFVRNNICRGKYKVARRPVLLNNWEATYFNFTDKKLVEIAKDAAGLGVELFVLDDGWFGVRDSDNSGLGDWYVNTDKIKCGLPELIRQINDLGLKFGIWIEPEMVNEDSDLYRAHPDWALRMPNRIPTRSRNQLVLDMSREDVIAYLYERMSELLRDNHIEYVKWDMNRSLSDLWSATLPAGRQGEVAHRYVLGLYKLMDQLTREFPDVLFEGCSGGGARYDAGILYYSPQIWCSDDTDPIHRLNIQYGSSFGYPISTVGAHVSASPNHQTGRSTPLNTRAVVAMNGTFGYELDPTELTEEEKEQIRYQIKKFKEYYHITQDGKYYRLSSIKDESYEAWQFVSKDKTEALLDLVITSTQPNPTLINLKLKGLEEEAIYEIDSKTLPDWGKTFEIVDIDMREDYIVKKEVFSGSALMHGGYTYPWVIGDYPAIQIHLKKIK